MIGQITSTLEQRALPRWHTQHREAFMKSEPLGTIEKSTQTTALFYANDNNKVIVEMVSLNMLNLVQFWDNLQTITPAEDNLSLPSMIKFTEQEMAMIRKTYAIVADSSPASKWRTTTKVWGFKHEGIFNKGKKVLMGILKPPDIPPQFQDPKPSQLSTGTNLSPSLSPEIITPSVVTSPSLQLIEQNRTNFKFKTREAGIFYQTFETRTRAHIESISGISLEKLENPRATKSSSTAMQTTINLVGSKEQTRKAKEYLKTLQSSLTHMQTFFVNVSMQKYRQLHEVKLACESISSPLCNDPLLEPHIVSLRLKPPLNTRGLKKMEFPCDVWATVCGPDATYVAEIHELLERLCNPFGCRIFYFNRSGLLNSILQDNTQRMEFVKYYNLCGVRANETIKNGLELTKLYVWSNNFDQRQDLQAILEEASKFDRSESISGTVTPRSDIPSSGVASEQGSILSGYNSEIEDDIMSFESTDSGLCHDFDFNNHHDKSSHQNDDDYTKKEVKTYLRDMTSQIEHAAALSKSPSVLKSNSKHRQSSQSFQKGQMGDQSYDEDIHSFLSSVQTSDTGEFVVSKLAESMIQQID